PLPLARRPRRGRRARDGQGIHQQWTAPSRADIAGHPMRCSPVGNSVRSQVGLADISTALRADISIVLQQSPYGCLQSRIRRTKLRRSEHDDLFQERATQSVETTMSTDPLNLLLSAWQDHQAQGRDVTPAELCRDFPELAEELGERVQALRMSAMMQGDD